jgi:high-affinity iron transporter
MRRVRGLGVGVAALVLGLFLLGGPLAARPAAAAGDEALIARLRAMVVALERTETAVKANDAAAAQAAYQEYRDGWSAIEDDIRPRDRAAYRAIEEYMRDVKAALRAQPLNTDEALTAIGNLEDSTGKLIETLPSTLPATQTADAQIAMRGLLAELDEATVALNGGDVATAAAKVGEAQERWLDVEGVLKVKSPSTYTAVENNLARAQSALAASTPDKDAARSALQQLKDDLAPYAESAVAYSAFDAGVTLLREGLEALLVVTALLAFLKRAGQEAKQGWIWGGAGFGILASLLVAIVLQVVFSQLATGAGREVMEGVTGLLAAGMLVYVSFWMHNKANIGAWQSYIRGKTTRALAQGGLLSLALIAFLAVFREGGETALFLIGMASSIALADLLLGLGVAAALLAILGVVFLGLGVRVPLRPFFLGTSVLLYYLAFKFLGTGVHALQVGGLAPATAAPLPAWDWLGLYPTWETFLPQLALLLATGVVLTLSHLPRRARAVRAPAS